MAVLTWGTVSIPISNFDNRLVIIFFYISSSKIYFFIIVDLQDYFSVSGFINIPLPISLNSISRNFLYSHVVLVSMLALPVTSVIFLPDF